MAAYVDNYAVLGADPSTVNDVAHEIARELRRTGFTVHEEKEASSRHRFVGLSFDGLTGRFSVKPSRLVRIQSALKELLLRNRCSGDLLEIMIGHVTWAMMCRREGLALLDKCYSFIHAVGDHSCK